MITPEEINKSIDKWEKEHPEEVKKARESNKKLQKENHD